jgi:hypothetical protein
MEDVEGPLSVSDIEAINQSSQITQALSQLLDHCI